MRVDYTLDVDDVVAARLLAIGIRPPVEALLFGIGIAGLLAWSVSPWRLAVVPLLISLAAGLGGFRLIQMARVREAALAAFQRNPTLRRSATATWDDAGITISPAAAAPERIAWRDLKPLRENARILLLCQTTGTLHAIPKRAFADKAALHTFCRLARVATHRSSGPS